MLQSTGTGAMVSGTDKCQQIWLPARLQCATLAKNLVAQLRKIQITQSIVWMPQAERTYAIFLRR
uniref:Uncharacterized protein n=1 Tax=Romanomermis culicivorax TaxID=13658 RepID=A0A915IRB3_ROMCU